MSLCRRKRVFQDLPSSSPVSSPLSKRLRSASYISPVGFLPWSSRTACRTLNDNDKDKAQSSASIENEKEDRMTWVELFVREMLNASSVDDAKSRAIRAFECFEKSLLTPTGAGTEDNQNQALRDENMALKDQIQEKDRENSILKRAVNIQQLRQKEYEGRNQQADQLRQLVSQQQEQLRTLEVKNYALAMHLQQAQQCKAMPDDRFHPHVF